MLRVIAEGGQNTKSNKLNLVIFFLNFNLKFFFRSSMYEWESIIFLIAFEATFCALRA